jgi:hypothetical protein
MHKTVLALLFVLFSTAVYAAKPVTDGPLPPADDYTVLAGKVTIGTVGEHMIGVVVDDGGPYRHLFRFWGDTSLKTFRATSPSASVVFRGDELVVMAADQEWFYSLSTSSGDFRGPRQPVGYTAARYVGYGLNHEIRPVAARAGGNNRRIIALDCEEFDSCIFNLDTDLGAGGGGSCDSGGLGSTSCMTSNSHGSCSVICSNNTYACCTNATNTSNASCRCKVY